MKISLKGRVLWASLRMGQVTIAAKTAEAVAGLRMPDYVTLSGKTIAIARRPSAATGIIQPASAGCPRRS